MFQIKRHKAIAPDDVIDSLFACHDRIRRLSQLAARLPRAHDAPAVDVEEAARSLLAYFRHALPMHIADEDLSIRPRLHEVSTSEDVRDAIAMMSDQHEQIDETLSVLLPQWELLRADGSRLSWMPGEFRKDSEKLRQQLDGHLAMEEETVFPAMRRDLSAESEAVILREMRERRALRGLETPHAEEAAS
jgi:iron-sulfur cluster repair protein YtfE (RIC family)